MLIVVLILVHSCIIVLGEFYIVVLLSVQSSKCIVVNLRLSRYFQVLSFRARHIILMHRFSICITVSYFYLGSAYFTVNCHVIDYYHISITIMRQICLHIVVLFTHAFLKFHLFSNFSKMWQKSR